MQSPVVVFFGAYIHTMRGKQGTGPRRAAALRFGRGAPCLRARVELSLVFCLLEWAGGGCWFHSGKGGGSAGVADGGQCNPLFLLFVLFPLLPFGLAGAGQEHMAEC